MEILSTGEKIKRARVYSGCTLKELCGDKISISKMSCIENDKVKPEKWIIEFIAKKLDLDVEYLTEGVWEQINSNINKLKDCSNQTDYEELLQYNLDYSLNYGYYDLSFRLMHMIFSYYLDMGKTENIQVITSKYYDICGKSGSEENQLLYSKDMAKYFYLNKEYIEAAAYYKNVAKHLKDTNSSNYELLAMVTYNEAVCNIKMKKYDAAFKIAQGLNDLMEHVQTGIFKADVYHMLGVLSLRLDKSKFEDYEKKSYENFRDDYAAKSNAIHTYASTMFDLGMKDKAITYIREGLRSYPKERTKEYVKYMLLCIEELVNYDVLSFAQEVSDEALNNSIALDDIKLIEKSYYYKAKILQKQGNYTGAEMYMNLSLDSLFKFGNKKDRYERYMEMGNMYFMLGQTADSIKYFNLALSLEKKM